MQNSRSVKSVKIFTRRDAEAQRKSCRAFLLGLSLHRYIERSRIFGKILPSLFSPFAAVQFRAFIDTSALRLSKGFYLSEKWGHKNLFDSIFLTSLRPFPSSVGHLPFALVAAGRAGPPRLRARRSLDTVLVAAFRAGFLCGKKLLGIRRWPTGPLVRGRRPHWETRFCQNCGLRLTWTTPITSALASSTRYNILYGNLPTKARRTF